MQLPFTEQQILLGILGIVGVAYWLSSFVVVYHLARFGVGTAPKQISAFFMTGSALLFLALIFFIFF